MGARAIVSPAWLPVGRYAPRLTVVVDECGQPGVHPDHDRAAVAAVAAVRTAERLELLAVDRGTAVAAVAGDHRERDGVHEGRDCHRELLTWAYGLSIVPQRAGGNVMTPRRRPDRAPPRRPDRPTPAACRAGDA